MTRSTLIGARIKISIIFVFCDEAVVFILTPNNASQITERKQKKTKQKIIQSLNFGTIKYKQKCQQIHNVELRNYI